ncbi:MAG: phosphotransferase [Gammaproteobacteria bacterium]|nr:phosphotransferase [Gammaproteobacteria bacterium]
MAEVITDKQALQQRHNELENWFYDAVPAADKTPLLLLSGDASFRCYFKATVGDTTYVLVDAPIDTEDSRTFVQIAENLRKVNVNVPEVYAVDYEKGFMCLSYMGETLLWDKLDILKQQNGLTEVQAIYLQAFNILIKIQGIREGSDILLPPFDGVMLQTEMDLFREWFCIGIMGLELSDEDNELLDHYFGLLIDAAMAQPQVCVHRDYHSRNLMYQADGNFGVLDFQDAVVGPVTYDVVSLIKDCYISWPKTMIREWALQYANMAQTAGIIGSFNDEEFLLGFDMMGVQRHLKAAGIFSRLYLRDGKTRYLADVPRTLSYIKEVLGDYPQMYGFGIWLEKNIYPMLITHVNNILKGKQAL